MPQTFKGLSLHPPFPCFLHSWYVCPHSHPLSMSKLIRYTRFSSLVLLLLQHLSPTLSFNQHSSHQISSDILFPTHAPSPLHFFLKFQQYEASKIVDIVVSYLFFISLKLMNLGYPAATTTYSQRFLFLKEICVPKVLGILSSSRAVWRLSVNKEKWIICKRKYLS